MRGDVKMILFLDGQNSRWAYDGLSHLHNNNVLVICFPYRTSIINQPNDSGINYKFKASRRNGNGNKSVDDDACRDEYCKG